MSLANLILTALKLSIFIFVLSLGLRSSTQDVTYLLRRPGELARSLLSMYVVMPVIAVVIALAFDLHPAVKIALVALSVSPIPPLLPKKGMKAGGQASYTVGLLVVAALFSIVFIPVVLEVFQLIAAVPLQMSPGKIALVVLTTVLVPLVLGIVLRHFAPGFAERAANPVGIVSTVLLVVTVLPILITAWPAVWSLVGNGTIFALATFVAVGLVVGHLLGGPDSDDRTVLALSTASRHPGVAITIASANFSEQKLLPAALLLYLLVSALASIPYLLWIRRRNAGDESHVDAVITRP